MMDSYFWRMSPLRRLIWLKFGAGGGGSSILKTVTGSLLHITDALAKPTKKFVATLEPIQDLHGQDAPYPAGGGVNKINFANCTAGITAFGLTSAISGEYVRFTGTCSSGGSHAWKFLLINSEQQELAATLSFASFFISGGSGLYISQTFINDDGKLTIGIGGLVTNQQYDFTVGIVGYTGTEPTAWSPYSNICPITGHTGANVVRTGKNLLAKPFVITHSTPQQFSDCFFIKADSYWISYDVANATSWRLGIKMYDINGNIASDSSYQPNKIGGAMTWNAINNIWLEGSNGTQKSNSITFPKDCYIRCILMLGDVTSSTTVSNEQLELGSAGTNYEAPSITTIPITFPDAAGTVYGGTLTNEGGEWKLRVDRATVVLTGNESFQAAGTVGSDHRFGLPLNTTQWATPKQENGSFISSHFKANNVGYNSGTFGLFYISATWLVIHDKDGFFESETAFKSWVASCYGSETPIQITYTLATPTEYTLSESQALTLLKGENVVWCDNSDDLELQYYAKAEETP